MKLSVTNETGRLEAVVLGIGVDQGAPFAINPLMKLHLEQNTYPTEEDTCKEIASFHKILSENNIEIFRPENVSGVEQIFTRDIGFVVDDKFCISNMKHPVRSKELAGIQYLIDQMNSNDLVRFPEDAVIEGGDVLLLDDHILVGLSDRTNEAGIAHLQSVFPHKKVTGLELVVDQEDADRNVLHLDCCFQPVGENAAIIYEEGFVNRPEIIYDLFSEDQLIKVNKAQKNAMFPNVFSIDTYTVIIDEVFTELKDQLLQRGFKVIGVNYRETSKLSGLLRCSTLPLRRSKSV